MGGTDCRHTSALLRPLVARSCGGHGTRRADHSQIKSTLQAQGQLQAIRAQLCSCVYSALSGKVLPPAGAPGPACPLGGGRSSRRSFRRASPPFTGRDA
eukprot:5642743-Prymnesium_polylepis.1